ncbi:MAG TPA: hypothetical protein VFJ67_07850, partial [Thermodesulfobacteriota bacterium]|nr:hypothetical protein [Thermodesulfobacteriota bacterium]
EHVIERFEPFPVFGLFGTRLLFVGVFIHSRDPWGLGKIYNKNNNALSLLKSTVIKHGICARTQCVPKYDPTVTLLLKSATKQIPFDLLVRRSLLSSNAMADEDGEAGSDRSNLVLSLFITSPSWRGEGVP